ncbi:MAG: hypothetical protein LBT41_01895 [Candidatus Methanoplasma sp.]|nr:hypothetical protein [Candidatus Methanoplasma sp.]
MTSTIKIGAGSVSVKTLAIAILLVLMVAVMAVAIYKNPNASEDLFDDPVIQGGKGIGSTLTYSIVDTEDTFDLEIVGESGSYYFADLTALAALVGSETEYQMFHKETGALRFAEAGDPERFEFDGETKELVVWTGITEGGVEWVFHSCEDDGIPYVIEIAAEDDSARAELLSTDIIEPSGDYERPDLLDKYFIYELTDGDDAVSTVYYRNAVVAEGGMYGILKLTVGAEEDEDGNEAETYQAEYLLASVDVHEFIFDFVTSFGSAVVSGSEVLDTVDGEITCDVYTIDTGDAGSITAYADTSAKIVYAADIETQEETHHMELLEYGPSDEA